MALILTRVSWKKGTYEFVRFVCCSICSSCFSVLIPLIGQQKGIQPVNSTAPKTAKLFLGTDVI